MQPYVKLLLPLAIFVMRYTTAAAADATTTATSLTLVTDRRTNHATPSVTTGRYITGVSHPRNGGGETFPVHPPLYHSFGDAL